MVVINNGLFVYRESVCVREKEKERETETETETERKTEIDRETQIFFSIRAAMGSDVTYLLFGEKKKSSLPREKVEIRFVAIESFLIEIRDGRISS